MTDTPKPAADTTADRADKWDDEADDWPTPEAREAAKRHDPANDDNALESLGKAIASPVLDADRQKPEPDKGAR